MNEAFLCPNCRFPYTADERVPLVLHCGHSLCMLCALAGLSTQDRRLPCLRCGFIQAASLAAIKELPINRTLLEAAGMRSDYRPNEFTDSPRLSSLFLSPRSLESPRQFGSLRVLDQFSGLSPNRLLFPPEPRDIPLSSPTTAALKCRRTQCSNDRYYFQGKIFDYCCQLCEQMDNPFGTSS